MNRALSVVLAFVLVMSAAGSQLAVQPATADPGGMVTISDSQIDSDLPPNTPMGNVESDLQERGVLTSAHSDTLEIIVTNPGRAKKYTDGAVFGGGPVAIVMRDDVNSEGRRVAIPVETLKDVLGYVPQSAYGTHEDGSTWQDPIQVQDGYAIVDVPHFSDNTVTFAGEINITQSKAGDGSQISYQVNDLDAASDVTVNMTGEMSTEWDNVSATGVADGGTVSTDVAGNTDPTGPSANGEPTVTFTGAKQLGFGYRGSSANYLFIRRDDGTTLNMSIKVYTIGGIGDIDGDGDKDVAIRQSDDYVKFIDTSGNLVNTSAKTAGTGAPIGGVADFDGDGDLDIAYRDTNDNFAFVDASGSVTSTSTNMDVRMHSETGDVDGDGTLEQPFEDPNGGVAWVDGSGETGNVSITETNVRGGVGDFDGDGDVDMSFTDSNDYVHLTDSAGNIINTSVQANYGYPGGMSDWDGDGDSDLLYRSTSDKVNYVDNSGNVGKTGEPGVVIGGADTILQTSDPSVDLDGDGTAEASVSGKLADGETVTKEIASLSPSDDTATVSTAGRVDLTFRFKERTVTQDPSVELNGTTVSHSGTLSDGSTVSKTINKSELQEGKNTVNISVGDGTLSADAPAPTVGLEYSHETVDDQTVTYDSEKWSERYNVSKTYASERSQANLTIPHQGTVIEMRSIEYRINESGGWTSMSSAYYSLDGTELVVDVDEISGGSVEANETVEVRTTASKVAVNSGSITVTEPTVTGSSLDSKIEINSWSDSSYIAVGGTPDGQRIHYSYNESYSNAAEYGIVTSSGENRLNLPNAGVGSTLRVSTIPVTVEPKAGDARVSVSDPKNTEPEFRVKPGPGTSGDEVDFTFVSAQDSTEYILYSKTEDIQRDSGTANSPITLTDDDSDEVLVFLVDDTNTSSDEGSNEDDGLPGQFDKEGGGVDWMGLLTIGLPVVGLLGAVVVYRRRRESGPSDSSGGAASRATGVIASIGGALVTAVTELSNRPRVVAVISILGALAALLTGVIQLPPGTGIVMVVAGIPLATYLVMQRFDSFNPLVFGTVSGAGVLLGLELLGGFVQPLLNALGPGVLILAIGVLILAYQGIQSYRKAESAPDEKNVIQIRGGD